VKSLIDQFRERRAHLATLRSGDEKGRLLDFLTWLETQQEINPMLVELRSRIDVSKLINPRRFRPKASSQKEIAAVGLYMMDQTRLGSSLWETAMKIHVSPQFRSNRIQDYSDEAMTCYINPFLDHVQAGLNDFGESMTVENVAELRFGLFKEPAFQSTFPETADALKKIAGYCGQSESAGSWFHVSVSCREALGFFVRELQKQEKLTPPKESSGPQASQPLTKPSRKRPGRRSEVIINRHSMSSQASFATPPTSRHVQPSSSQINMPQVSPSEIRKIAESQDDFGHELRVGAAIRSADTEHMDHGGTYTDSVCRHQSVRALA
jgi:hypothetical protein